MDKPTFVYVTYIATTLEQLWDALTSEPFTQQYWGEGTLQSDWQTGSSIVHVNPAGEADWQGEVLQSEPPYRLGYTVQPGNLDEDSAPLQPSRVRFQLEQQDDRVKLTLIHDLLDIQSCAMVGQHWTMTLTNLKRILEAIAHLSLAA